MRSSEIEWATVAPGLTIVASAERGWIHSHGMMSPFDRPMYGPGSIPTTRQLLDSAIKMGCHWEDRSPEPPLTLARWAYRVCGLYQSSRVTPPFMLEAASRFQKQGRTILAEWARTKAVEETGHDTLALRDLHALGYEAEALVAAVFPPRIAALVAFFERQVYAGDPIGCFGYTYTLERLAIELGEEYIQEVEAVLSPGMRATRCLRVHSGVGSDPRHVEETVKVVASLPPEERILIARACYEVAALCYEPRDDEPLAEKPLQGLLSPYKNKRSQT